MKGNQVWTYFFEGGKFFGGFDEGDKEGHVIEFQGVMCRIITINKESKCVLLAREFKN